MVRHFHVKNAECGKGLDMKGFITWLTIEMSSAGSIAFALDMTGAPWTVFDRNLVEKVLEDHYLPKSLAKFMPEDRRTLIEDILEDLIGLRPPSWVVVPQIAETVLQLADAGHVILVGRGANFITARLANVFHVRLVATLPERIARMQKLNHLTPEEASKVVARTDRGSGRYVKMHFHASVEDDVHYHLVINTDRIPCPDAAGLIADGMRRCIQMGGRQQPGEFAKANSMEGI